MYRLGGHDLRRSEPSEGCSGPLSGALAFATVIWTGIRHVISPAPSVAGQDPGEGDEGRRRPRISVTSPHRLSSLYTQHRACDTDERASGSHSSYFASKTCRARS